jgi:hypothetical protein
MNLFRVWKDKVRVIKHQGIKMRTEEELKLHLVLMFVLNGYEWSVSHPGCFGAEK